MDKFLTKQLPNFKNALMTGKSNTSVHSSVKINRFRLSIDLRNLRTNQTE